MTGAYAEPLQLDLAWLGTFDLETLRPEVESGQALKRWTVVWLSNPHWSRYSKK